MLAFFKNHFFKITEAFFNFLNKISPPKSVILSGPHSDSEEFFYTGLFSSKLKNKNNDTGSEKKKYTEEGPVQENEHGEIPEFIRNGLSVDAAISDQLDLNETKGWAQILSEQINRVEGTCFIIDPYNSHYFYPFGNQIKPQYSPPLKATENYTVFGFLKNRIVPNIGNIPIGILRPKTGTMLVIQFEKDAVYLLRYRDRIRIFKQNSNTTKILSMSLKDYRKDCSNLF